MSPDYIKLLQVMKLEKESFGFQRVFPHLFKEKIIN